MTDDQIYALYAAAWSKTKTGHVLTQEDFTDPTRAVAVASPMPVPPVRAPHEARAAAAIALGVADAKSNLSAIEELRSKAAVLQELKKLLA